MVHVCVLVQMSGCQRTGSAIIHQEPATLFCDRVSHWWVRLAGSAPQDLPATVPSSEIIGAYPCPSVLCQGTNSGPHACGANTFPTEPALTHPHPFFSAPHFLADLLMDNLGPLSWLRNGKESWDSVGGRLGQLLESSEHGEDRP